MRRIRIILKLLCLTASTSYGCDVCGNGAGGYYNGILPQFSTGIAGLRYRYSSLQTHLGAGGSSTYLTARESYHIAEVWGGWVLAKRFRLTANIPLSFSTKTNDAGAVDLRGLGDAGIQGFYRLLNRSSATKGKKLVSQNAWIGSGIKLPTGKYQPPMQDPSIRSTNFFQLGTGSLDFLLLAGYDLGIGAAGLNISWNYKFNTANRYGYNYGNKLNGTTQLYYKLKPGKELSLAPNLGIGIEHSGTDTDRDYSVYASGGYLLYGSLGAEAACRKVAAGLSFQPVIRQELAKGMVKAGNRFMLHCSFLF